ncbi:hypothetical protein EIN_467120 [Entamoeba invadens IP1]|uniref:Uncharacterized protein n=1 Tax=Entamoeba invadens IP1 TaxID=370355 RepID=A0A0A1TWF2_ENTIV|nr:hypothetical protein EIN_467120 [Entamoeba invadens IP1]ELP83658.1 hypothetical protein EIN_467120 [Entamoeba invadens IP1]|eukprot:XP_004183004.1 hypothetical protein EIN_467120 [Entamoeba invadens IP1]
MLFLLITLLIYSVVSTKFLIVTKDGLDAAYLRVFPDTCYDMSPLYPGKYAKFSISADNTISAQMGISCTLMLSIPVPNGFKYTVSEILPAYEVRGRMFGVDTCEYPAAEGTVEVYMKSGCWLMSNSSVSVTRQDGKINFNTFNQHCETLQGKFMFDYGTCNSLEPIFNEKIYIQLYKEETADEKTAVYAQRANYDSLLIGYEPEKCYKTDTDNNIYSQFSVQNGVVTVKTGNSCNTLKASNMKTAGSSDVYLYSSTSLPQHIVSGKIFGSNTCAAESNENVGELYPRVGCFKVLDGKYVQYSTSGSNVDVTFYTDDKCTVVESDSKTNFGECKDIKEVLGVSAYFKPTQTAPVRDPVADGKQIPVTPVIKPNEADKAFGFVMFFVVVILVIL